ncbi:hypothetical protein SRHO_G00228550 [Serrasalmus rhombeus]
MVEVTSQQGVILALVSLVTLGFVSAICLGCRKKSKIVQEDNQLYIPQIFQREGSRFAVTRSKTVTRPNQITSEASPTVGNSARASYVQPQAVEDIQCSYQNISKPCCGSLEPTYVHPIPTPPPPDEFTDTDIDGAAYENVFPTKNIDHDSDSEDYENADFLKIKDDDDEPDYVNTQSN